MNPTTGRYLYASIRRDRDAEAARDRATVQARGEADERRGAGRTVAAVGAILAATRQRVASLLRTHRARHA